MYIDKKLGKAFKEKRTAMKLTQDELADIIHITKASYSNYENGRLTNVEFLIRIMNLFDMDYVDFFKKNKQAFKVIIDEELQKVYTIKEVKAALGITQISYAKILKDEENILFSMRTGYDRKISQNHINYLENLKNKTYYELYGTQKRGIY